MSEETIIDEAELTGDLEPSEAFAALVARVGGQAGVGKLGIAAFDELVHERASGKTIAEAPGEDATEGVGTAG
jgi:hypothetical protein